MKCAECGYRDVGCAATCAVCGWKLDATGTVDRIASFQNSRPFLTFAIGLATGLVVGYVPSFALVCGLNGLGLGRFQEALGIDVAIALVYAIVGRRQTARHLLAAYEGTALSERRARKAQRRRDRKAKKREQLLDGIEHLEAFGDEQIGFRDGELVVVKGGHVNYIRAHDIVSADVVTDQAFDGIVDEPDIPVLPGPEGAYAYAREKTRREARGPRSKYVSVYKVKVETRDMARPVRYFGAVSQRDKAERLAARIKMLVRGNQEAAI